MALRGGSNCSPFSWFVHYDVPIILERTKKERIREVSSCYCYLQAKPGGTIPMGFGAVVGPEGDGYDPGGFGAVVGPDGPCGTLHPPEEGKLSTPAQPRGCFIGG